MKVKSLYVFLLLVFLCGCETATTTLSPTTTTTVTPISITTTTASTASTSTTTSTTTTSTTSTNPASTTTSTTTTSTTTVPTTTSTSSTSLTSTSLGTSTTTTSTTASTTTTSTTSTTTATTTSTTTTTIAGCYIGAYVDDYVSYTPSFEALIGRNLAVNLRYVINWNTSFPSSDCDAINSYEGVPMLTWEPRLSTVNTLDAISGGSYDGYITAFAQAAKNWGKLIYLRFAHEMNGNWYPWDGFHNGESTGPAKYIAAWKHIRDIFTQAGANNVKWVWSPNVDSVPNESWNEASDYYPGDSYVDWIGFDGYNWGQGNWKTFDQIFSSSYSIFSTYNKPLAITEFASAPDDGGNPKASWITDAFSKLKNSYTKVKIFCWFNTNKERDWRINSSADALNSFKNAINDSYFLEVKPGY